jgi:hypothetical protein
MANPTSGFQLSALPQPLSMPSNLGKFDVSETQQAYSSALKNAQQTALLGPQTQAAIANAAYQKGLAEQQSRLISPEEAKLLAQYRQQQLEAQNASSVAEAVAPKIGPLAVKQQGLLEAQTDVFGNRLAQGGKTGTSSVDLGGNVSMPVSVDLKTGAYTPMAGASFGSSLVNKPRGEIMYQTQGAPYVRGNKTVQDYVAYQRNPITGQVFEVKGVGKVTQDANLAPPIWNEQSGSALGSFNGQAGVGQKAMSKEIEEGNDQQPVVGNNQVYVPFADKVVDKNSQLAKALPAIEKAISGVDPRAVASDTQDAKIQEYTLKNSENLNALSTQALALQNAKRAFDQVKQSGVVKTGPWWRVLSPDVAALFGDYQAQDFDSAMLSYIEKSTGTLKNVRAYQGLKDLLLGPKPRLTDKPEVIESKFNYMTESLEHAQDIILAENYMLQNDVPLHIASRIASTRFIISPNGDYNTWAAKKGIKADVASTTPAVATGNTNVKSSGPVLVNSQSEIDALPDGTVIMDAKGNRGVKGSK